MHEDCPAQDRLEQFVLGKLPEPNLSMVARHTDQCQHCQALLTTLDNMQDDLLVRLRSPQVLDADTAEPLATKSLDQPPNNSEQRLDTTGNRINRVLARLEDRDTPATGRDWMQWARLTFGENDAGEYVLVVGCRLEKVLGVGGMGVVFSAYDEQLRRSVAIKVMRPERLADAAARQRFLREARAIAAIQHEHIVPVFQVGEEQNVPYFVMPLLRGRSLEDRLGDSDRFGLPELLGLAVQIADGIAAAHDHGLIHRDIKPSNIWVEQSSQRKPEGDRVSVRLLDFGLVRAGRDDGQEPLSEDGLVVGTPAYMSPEQAQGGDIDQRSDLFSFGCVLFRMATGRLPFPGRTVTEQLAALVKDSPPPLRELNDALPVEFEQLVRQLLARDPDQRPRSAADVRDRLQTLLEHVTHDDTEQSHRRLPRQETPAAARRRVITVSLGLMVIIAGSCLAPTMRQWLAAVSEPASESLVQLPVTPQDITPDDPPENAPGPLPETMAAVFPGLTARLSDGDLTITDDNAANNMLTLSVSGADLVVSDDAEPFVSAPEAGTLSNGNKTLTIPAASVTGTLTINSATGTDTIQVGKLGTTFPAGLTINGGADADTVRLDGDVTFAENKSLSVTAGVVKTGRNADIVTAGTGTIAITADDVAIDATSTLGSASTVSFATQTAERAIDVGSKAKDNDRLGLTDGELDRITAGMTRIGDKYAGKITVSTAISHGNGLSLATDNTIDVRAGITMAADKNLSIESTGKSAMIFLPHESITTTGTGAASITAVGSIWLSGTRLTTVNGGITVTANAAGTALGRFDGIFVKTGTILRTTGRKHRVDGHGYRNRRPWLDWPCRSVHWSGNRGVLDLKCRERGDDHDYRQGTKRE